MSHDATPWGFNASPLSDRTLVFVHGSSGCGKSSLIRAGVLPRLEHEHWRQGVRWRVATMHPGSSPLWNLALAIAELIDSEAAGNMPLASVRPIRRLLNRGRDALRLLQARHGLGEEGNVCLLLDQFEELFRYAREFPREEAEILIEILLGFEKDLPQGIHAVVTMRSDHLGECGHYEGFAELVNSTQYLLPRMDNKSLLRAIREPAALFGGDVSIDLGMRLVEHSRNDVDALPLVQHCLMRMWEVTSDEPGESGTQNLTYVVDGEREPTTGPTKFLQAQDYPGLRQLISNHADEILDELTQAGGENLRATEYLFRALTEVDTDGRGIRRPQRFADLVAVTGADRSTLTEIVDRFRRPDCGFLIPSTGLALSDDTVIDIGHEALIRCWTRLDDKAVDSSSGKPVGWLPREQEDGRVWRALLVSAESYREIGYWRRLTLSSRPDVLLKSVIPPIAFERLDWFQELPSPRWSERYDGGWELVDKLMQKALKQRKNFRRMKWFMVAYLLISAWWIWLILSH